MKKKQKEELRQKTTGELEVELVKKRKGLVETRFKLAQGQLKNVHDLSKIRGEIAFIKTIISEKVRDLKEKKKK